MKRQKEKGFKKKKDKEKKKRILLKNSLDSISLREKNPNKTNHSKKTPQTSQTNKSPTKQNKEKKAHQTKFILDVHFISYLN